MEVVYAPKFIRMLKILPHALQEEVIKKIELFKNKDHHRHLNVHKLRGRLQEQYAFSVNYAYRIVFVYLPTKPKKAYLIAVGDHDVYDR
ncbi:MAG: hypothetical protein WC654_01655 [Patescibacteria group bacterium]